MSHHLTCTFRSSSLTLLLLRSSSSSDSRALIFSFSLRATLGFMLASSRAWGPGRQAGRQVGRQAESRQAERQAGRKASRRAVTAEKSLLGSLQAVSLQLGCSWHSSFSLTRHLLGADFMSVAPLHHSFTAPVHQHVIMGVPEGSKAAAVGVGPAAVRQIDAAGTKTALTISKSLAIWALPLSSCCAANSSSAGTCTLTEPCLPCQVQSQEQANTGQHYRCSVQGGVTDLAMVLTVGCTVTSGCTVAQWVQQLHTAGKA